MMLLRWKFQSTLPQGERHEELAARVYIAPISIHAPARGATNGKYLEKSILIFQSTLPQGERRHMARKDASCTKISIHAPARGATYV